MVLLFRAARIVVSAVSIAYGSEWLTRVIARLNALVRLKAHLVLLQSMPLRTRR